jgi:hypothetical protein
MLASVPSQHVESNSQQSENPYRLRVISSRSSAPGTLPGDLRVLRRTPVHNEGDHDRPSQGRASRGSQGVLRAIVGRQTQHGVRNAGAEAIAHRATGGQQLGSAAERDQVRMGLQRGRGKAVRAPEELLPKAVKTAASADRLPDPCRERLVGCRRADAPEKTHEGWLCGPDRGCGGA